MSNDLPLDILVYAIIAVFLVLKLTGVLGKRIGHERKFDDSSPLSEKANPNPVNAENHQDSEFTAEETSKTNANAKTIGWKNQLKLSPEINATLEKIKAIDKEFVADEFLTNATSAFEMVFEAFVNGDKETLKSLLSDEVYGAFEQALTDRSEKGHILKDSLLSIHSSKIIGAELIKNQASIMIEFYTEQINATYDKEGQLIDGNGKISNKVAVEWTFTKNLKSKDPTWALSATETLES